MKNFKVFGKAVIIGFMMLLLAVMSAAAAPEQAIFPETPAMGQPAYPPEPHEAGTPEYKYYMSVQKLSPKAELNPSLLSHSPNFPPEAEPDDIIEERRYAASSGTCGANLTRTLDDAGTLTICGTGNMTDYNFCSSPWRNATNVKKVVINSGVTSIGYGAFYNCSSLTSIVIPDSVTSIGDWAFCDCVKLTEFTVDDNNTSYSTVDGVLFNKDKTVLIQYPSGNTSQLSISQ